MDFFFEIVQRSKSEFISDDADLAKIFERKNSILEKENNPNYARYVFIYCATVKRHNNRSCSLD